MEEIWKPVVGYEGLYEVSNLGRVKSLPKLHKMDIRKNYKGYMTKEKILKNILNNKGYFTLSLVKDFRKTHKQVPRLVAQAFIPNPDNLPQVNHKDGNKTNNKVDNLEWCTPTHNIKEAWRLGLCKPTTPMKGLKNELCPNSIKINQYDLNGNFIKEWSCSYEAVRELGLHSNHIIDCCKHKRNKCGGFKWEYAKSEDNI